MGAPRAAELRRPRSSRGIVAIVFSRGIEESTPAAAVKGKYVRSFGARCLLGTPTI
jgi:hypothetical protein